MSNYNAFEKVCNTWGSHCFIWSDCIAGALEATQGGARNPITNPGTTIATGYFAGTAANSVGAMIILNPYYGLGRKIDGTSDILAVGIKTLDNNYTVYPSLIVRELT